jgi:hypothetical protein
MKDVEGFLRRCRKKNKVELPKILLKENKIKRIFLNSINIVIKKVKIFILKLIDTVLIYIISIKHLSQSQTKQEFVTHL